MMMRHSNTDHLVAHEARRGVKNQGLYLRMDTAHGIRALSIYNLKRQIRSHTEEPYYCGT